jgi:hypothetical protein
MGLRLLLALAQSDPFEPDPAHTGVGKGSCVIEHAIASLPKQPGLNLNIISRPK